MIGIVEVGGTVIYLLTYDFQASSAASLRILFILCPFEVYMLCFPNDSWELNDKIYLTEIDVLCGTKAEMGDN